MGRARAASSRCSALSRPAGRHPAGRTFRRDPAAQRCGRRRKHLARSPGGTRAAMSPGVRMVSLAAHGAAGGRPPGRVPASRQGTCSVRTADDRHAAIRSRHMEGKDPTGRADPAGSRTGIRVVTASPAPSARRAFTAPGRRYGCPGGRSRYVTEPGARAPE
jgi:hypothetical protein